MDDRRSLRTTASSELTGASCRRRRRDGPAPPQVETSDGGQDERAEGERHRADHELHNDARLPVLPALEKTARQRRAGVLVRAEAVDGSGGAHGAVDGRRAVPAGGGNALGVSAVVDANAVPRDGLVGRDGDEWDDRADEGDGGRRGNHRRGGVGVSREEETVHVRAQEQDERGAVGRDGRRQRSPEQRRERDADEAEGQRRRPRDRECINHLVQLDPAEKEDEAEQRDGEDEEKDDERHRGKQLAPEDRKGRERGDEEQVERLPLAFAADRPCRERGRDETQQRDLEHDQEHEEVHAVVGARAAEAKRVPRHGREHCPAKATEEDDVERDRERRAPCPHPRAVLLGHDRVPQRSRDRVHPTSSEVALRNASSRPPSTGVKLDTRIPAPVSAIRMSEAVLSSPSYSASIEPFTASTCLIAARGVRTSIAASFSSSTLMRSRRPLVRRAITSRTEPVARMRPWSMMPIIVQSSVSSGRMWLEMMIVLPMPWSSLRISPISTRAPGPRPEAGSAGRTD